jgi:hypothetical protein
VRERLTNGQAERDMELRYRIVTVDLDTMACTARYTTVMIPLLSITLQYIARLPQHHYHRVTSQQTSPLFALLSWLAISPRLILRAIPSLIRGSPAPIVT